MARRSSSDDARDPRSTATTRPPEQSHDVGEPATNGASATDAGEPNPDAAANRKARLVLAERRTAYALMRTGLAVMVVPLSIFTVLAATTRFWQPDDAPWLFGTILAAALGLLALGAYLAVHAVRNIRHTDRELHALQDGEDGAPLDIETLSERWK